MDTKTSITDTITECESTLSRIPPCPGNMLEKSLISILLFIDENIKSPRKEITEKNKDKAITINITKIKLKVPK